MDVGLILSIRQLLARPQPLAQLYADSLAEVQLAEELGFDFVRIGEHHFAPDAWAPAPLPILGWLAGRTRRMRIGSHIFLLQLHNPLLVAEDVATIDLMSGGRFDFEVGAGPASAEHETFGFDA